MQQRISIEEARERAREMQLELYQAENMDQMEEGLDVLDWVFALCLRALGRGAKLVYFPGVLAEARGKVRRNSLLK